MGAAVPASALAALAPEGVEARLLGWARDEVLQDPDLLARLDRQTHLVAWLSPFNNRPEDRRLQ
jgi:hypothetical protein